MEANYSTLSLSFFLTSSSTWSYSEHGVASLSTPTWSYSEHGAPTSYCIRKIMDELAPEFGYTEYSILYEQVGERGTYLVDVQHTWEPSLAPQYTLMLYKEVVKKVSECIPGHSPIR